VVLLVGVRVGLSVGLSVVVGLSVAVGLSDPVGPSVGVAVGSVDGRVVDEGGVADSDAVRLVVLSLSPLHPASEVLTHAARYVRRFMRGRNSSAVT
jgi:hypothetical protein